MLPGADAVGTADPNVFLREKAADEVGNEAIVGPVAAADDVSSAACRDAAAMLGEFAGMKEALAVGGSDDLRAGLGGAVGIVTAKRIGFAIAPHPFFVLV